MKPASLGSASARRRCVPVVYARPGLCAPEAVLAASAMAASAAALDPTPCVPRWWHVLRGAELLAPAPDASAPATVTVHAHASHPGVPFAFVAVRITRRGALAGLVAGTVVDAALAEACDGRYDVTRPPAP